MKLHARLARLEATRHGLRAEGTGARERLAARLEIAYKHDPDVFDRVSQDIRDILERRDEP